MGIQKQPEPKQVIIWKIFLTPLLIIFHPEIPDVRMGLSQFNSQR